jgi:hypothetical protein
MNSVVMKDLPKIGKNYPFFDDGKIRTSRLHKATITRIFKFSEIPEDLVCGRLLEYGLYTLADYIKKEQSVCNWLFAPETDYVIEASIPVYDDHLIYFIRTKDKGWFSIDFLGSWQGGRLDVSWDKYKGLIKYYQEEKWYDEIKELQKIMG